MGVAQVNDGFGVSELEFQQNVLDLDRIVAFLLVFDDLFNSAQLTDFCGSLDVLLMNLFVVGAVDDCAQEEENTLKGSHWFEHFHDITSSKLVQVLNWNIYHSLDVVPIELKHLAHALDALLGWHSSQVFSNEIWRQSMTVQQHSLDVLQLSVVLKGSLVHTFLLTKSGNFWSIVLVPDFHLHDGFSDLWGQHNVNF